jgi:hypothetical protein
MDDKLQKAIEKMRQSYARLKNEKSQRTVKVIEKLPSKNKSR